MFPFSIRYAEQHASGDRSDEDGKRQSMDTSKGTVSDLSTSDERNVDKTSDKLVDSVPLNELARSGSSEPTSKGAEANGEDKSNNNNHKNSSSPMLTIASVKSLSNFTVDNRLLFDESNIIISDDEEFTFDNAL